MTVLCDYKSKCFGVASPCYDLNTTSVSWVHYSQRLGLQGDSARNLWKMVSLWKEALRG